MRLRDVRLILEQEIPRLSPEFQGYPGLSGMVEFTNRFEVQKALAQMVDIPSFERTAKKLLGQPVFSAASGMVDGKVQQGLESGLIDLTQRATSVLIFLKKVLPGEPGGYLTVHLPSDDSELSKVEDRFQSLVLAFERPVQIVYGTTLKVTLVEPGSTLIELGMTGSAVLSGVLVFMGQLLSLGIKKAKLKQEQAVAERRLIEIGQEQVRTKLLEVELERAQLSKEAAELDLRRLKLSVSTVAETFTAGLDEPHEAAALFTKAVDEIALLHEANVTFELQSNADLEIRRHYPPEALPASSNGSRELDFGVKGLLPEGDVSS